MPTVTLNLLGSALPAVAVASTPPFVSDIATDGGEAPSAETIAAGMNAAALITVVNDHAARCDIAAIAQIGLPCILNGLALSDGGGLSLAVSQGQAMVKGIVEYMGGTVSLSASTSSRVWLETNGSLSVGNTSYVPASPAVYLGLVTTDGTGITDFELAGVFSLVGGLPSRVVGDAFKPSDTPAASSPMQVTRTDTARWLWDGGQYCLLVPASSITTLSTSATTSDIVTYLRSLGLATA